MSAAEHFTDAAQSVMVRFTTGVSLRTDKHARFVFKYWQRHSGGALNTAPLMLEDMEREYTIC